MIIRKATPQDVEQMAICAMHMFYESPHYRQFSIDAEKVYQMMLWLVSSDDGIALVVEKDSQIVGGFLGQVAQHWFGHHKAACDFGLFLDKDHRGGRTAIDLIHAANEMAKQKGAHEMIITNTTGVQGDRVEKLYQYTGFTRLGGSYYKLLEQ